MYSPKISEELVPYLYSWAKRERVKMTILVNRILKNEIEKNENERKETKHEHEDQ